MTLKQQVAAASHQREANQTGSSDSQFVFNTVLSPAPATEQTGFLYDNLQIQCLIEACDFEPRGAHGTDPGVGGVGANQPPARPIRARQSSGVPAPPRLYQQRSVLVRIWCSCSPADCQAVHMKNVAVAAEDFPVVTSPGGPSR